MLLTVPFFMRPPETSVGIENVQFLWPVPPYLGINSRIYLVIF